MSSDWHTETQSCRFGSHGTISVVLGAYFRRSRESSDLFRQGALCANLSGGPNVGARMGRPKCRIGSEPFRKSHALLESGQGRADAALHSVTERGVTVLGPVDDMVSVEPSESRLAAGGAVAGPSSTNGPELGT